MWIWRFLTFLWGFLRCVSGHGHLIVPPQRSSLWRTRTGAPINVDDNGLNCGGFARQFERNKGRCGVCGDAWDLPVPRPHEDGGKFGQGYIAAEYTAGDIVDIVVNITANHFGWFELRLCPHDDVTRPVTQSCLDENLLLLADDFTPFSAGMTRYYVGRSRKIIKVQMKLPDHVTCEKCVLQWKYKAGNSWGCMKKCCIGCGNQEHFYNCADVRITRPDDTDDVDHKPRHVIDNSYIIAKTATQPQKIRFYDEISDPFHLDSHLPSHHVHSVNVDQYSLGKVSLDKDERRVNRVDSVDYPTQSHHSLHHNQLGSFVKIRWREFSDNDSFDLLEVKPKPEVKPSLTCVPSIRYHDVRGMGEWCNLNCPACPVSHCICY